MKKTLFDGGAIIIALLVIGWAVFVRKDDPKFCANALKNHQIAVKYGVNDLLTFGPAQAYCKRKGITI